jgi:hypothetical protein
MGGAQGMIMVDLITTLTANLLAIPKVCLAEVGDRRRGHSVQIRVGVIEYCSVLKLCY